MAHWTALRTVSTGDVGLCGGTEAWLALLNFGEYCILRGASAVGLLASAGAPRLLLFFLFFFFF